MSSKFNQKGLGILSSVLGGALLGVVLSLVLPSGNGWIGPPSAAIAAVLFAAAGGFAGITVGAFIAMVESTFSPSVIKYILAGVAGSVVLHLAVAGPLDFFSAGRIYGNMVAAAITGTVIGLSYFAGAWKLAPRIAPKGDDDCGCPK